MKKISLLLLVLLLSACSFESAPSLQQTLGCQESETSLCRVLGTSETTVLLPAEDEDEGRSAAELKSFVLATGKTPDETTIRKALVNLRAFGVTMKHHRSLVERLDAVGSTFSLPIPDLQPRFAYISSNGGYIYVTDKQLGRRAMANDILMNHLRRLQTYYLRVDASSVTLVVSPTEEEDAALEALYGSKEAAIAGVAEAVRQVASVL